jgi:hypothetical protein
VAVRRRYTGCNEYILAIAIMALVRTKWVSWGKATALFYKELEQIKIEEGRCLSPVPSREPTAPDSPHRGAIWGIS